MKKKHKELIESHLHDIEITVRLLDEGVQDKKWDKYKTAGMGVFLANVVAAHANCPQLALC